MNITIKSIPHKSQRYDTLGDWFYDENGDLIISVSNDNAGLPTEDHQFLCALHELIEIYLCKKDGVTQEQVDHFDMIKYHEYSESDFGEPGDHPRSPYREQHRKAMLIEMLMANFLKMENYGVIR
jgi:hypothetical protein